jgi:hypothetical protein
MFRFKKIMRFKRLIIAALSMLPGLGFAQTTVSLDEGYYRVQNSYNSRYLALLDNTGYAKRNGASIDADLYALRSLNDTNKIMSNPATIVHLSKGSTGYVCSAQGTSTKDITSYEMTLHNYSGGIVISVEVGSYGKTILTEYDYTTPDKFDANDNLISRGKTLPDSGLVNQTGASSKSRRIYWKFEKIDASTSNYVGFAPALSLGGKYYDTFYAEFPFKVVSDGVTVYSVYTIYDGKAVLKPFAADDIIPGGTPVVVECSSKDDSSNKIQPLLTTASALSQNQLKGVYFNYYCDQVSTKIHDNRTKYDASKMRVLGVSDGKLAFINATNLTYLPANKAYLSVPVGTGDVVGVMSYSDYVAAGINGVTIDKNDSKSGIYTLGGQKTSKVAKSALYIINGQKVVVKK